MLDQFNEFHAKELTGEPTMLASLIDKDL